MSTLTELLGQAVDSYQFDPFRRWLLEKMAQIALGNALHPLLPGNKEPVPPSPEPGPYFMDVSPHYKSFCLTTGQFEQFRGVQQSVELRSGRLYIIAFDAETQKTFLIEPLSLTALTYTEHPCDRVLRMIEKHTLAVAPEILALLQNHEQRDTLLRHVEFTYAPNKTLSGKILEVLVDGTLIVRPSSIPPEWRPQAGDPINYHSPDVLYVPPSALISSSLDQFFSQLDTRGAEISREVQAASLAIEKDPGMLGIDDGGIPFGNLDPKNRTAWLNASRAMYHHTKENANSLYYDIGFNFNLESLGANQYERARTVLQMKLPISYRSMMWVAETLKTIGLPLSTEEDMAIFSCEVGDSLYFRTLGYYPYSDFGRVYRLDKNGTLTQCYGGPGRVIGAAINPRDSNQLFVSVDGYPQTHELFQCVFSVDLTTGLPTVINFPGESRGGKDELYVSRIYFTSDGYLLFVRYGFVDENGGAWLLDPNDISQKVPWLLADHVMNMETTDQSLTTKFPPHLLNKETPNTHPSNKTSSSTPSSDSPLSASPNTFFTYAPMTMNLLNKYLVVSQKNVAENFAMQTRFWKMEGTGLNRTIVGSGPTSAYTVIGWNPTIHDIDKAVAHVNVPLSPYFLMAGMPSAGHELPIPQ